VEIKITDSHLFFTFDNEEQRRNFNRFFTFEDKTKVFVGGKYDVNKIKRINFIKNKKGLNWLRSGFLQEFLVFAKRNNIKIDVDDKRTSLPHQKIKFTIKDLEKYFPFDYNQHQIEALQRLLKVRRGIIKMPTGSGKGDLIISFLLETQEPALVIVDRVLLAEQLTQRAKESGLKNVGILTGKKNDTENKNIVFATIGSIKKIPAFYNFRILIVDELHHASSKRFQDFLSETSFPVQVGFSATPDKEDSFIFALIRQHFGGIVFEVLAETMVKNEVIAKPKIIFLENEVNPMIDWPSSYKECIIKNAERNKLIVDIVEKHKEKILVLIKDVKNKQGEILKNYITENTSKNVEFIQGATKNRQEILDWFEHGDLDVLISTNILNEGISLKEIRILVNASGGKSKVENLQKIGRGTRIKQDKKEVIVYDFLDLGNKFTQKHSKERMKIYIKEGFTDIVRQSSVI